MSASGLKNRVRRIQRSVGPARDDGTITLVELLRSYWQQDRAGYMQLVRDGVVGASMLLPTFEREEAGRRKTQGSTGSSRRDSSH